jgi:hypothetical protein
MLTIPIDCDADGCRYICVTLWSVQSILIDFGGEVVYALEVASG